MRAFTPRQLGFGILRAAQSSSRVNRFNMLGGRGSTRGGLEYVFDADLSPDDRQRAALAFDQLVRGGKLRCTYSDVVAPGDWFELTDAGRTALERQALDDLDEALLKFGSQLMELRDGAWSAVASGQRRDSATPHQVRDGEAPRRRF